MGAIRSLLKKDWRVLRNVRRLASEQSLFKVTFILFFASLLLFGLFAMFIEGFQFLDSLGGVGLMLVSRLFALFFLGLAVMLVLSSTVTSFATFFRSDETGFLLLKPLSVGQISVYKSIQSAVYSSWAFFFTIIPFVGAYAWHEHLPIFFSIWTLVFSIPLVLLCSGIGSIICLVLARWLPRGRRLVTLIALLLLAGAWWIATSLAGAAVMDDDSMLLLGRLIPGLRVASNPLWPSWWVSEGIMSLTRDQWGRGLMLWSVLMANVLLVGVLVEATGRAVFYEAWQRIQYGSGRRTRRGVLFRPLDRFLGFLANDTRALVLKDIRVFFRDPAQWTQGVIFFGLLGLYFLNLRNMRYHMLPAEWRNLIAFLNVFSVSAVMCSFGSRFVFPQLSLEGHGFWIVGLSPTTMGRVLFAKFGLALTGMMTASLSLMYLSTRMLNVPAPVQGVAGAIAFAMSFGIAGLSTGLGAVFLDLKQQNPAAIVSGFGGTLNLVLSLAFMFGTIVPFGVLFHLHYVGHISPAEMRIGLAVGAVWLAGVTTLTTLLPLHIGRRSLLRREY